MHNMGGTSHQRIELRKRAPAATTTATTATTATTTTATRTHGRTTTAAERVRAAAATSSTTTTSAGTGFQPGVAASGSATSSAPDTPPAAASFITSGTPSGTFAQQASWTPHAVSSHGVPIAAGATAPSTSTAGLSKPALYAVIGGASAGGILLLALIGFCCWKRRKTRAEKDNLGWRDLDSGAAARPVRTSQLVYNSPGAEKPWAQQSFSSFTSLDGKGSGIRPQPQAFVRSASDNFSSAQSFAGDSYAQDRQELFSSPRAMPRNYTNESLHSFAPPPSVFAQHPDPRGSTAQSVNSVIDFSSAPLPRSMSSQQSHPPEQGHAYPPSRLASAATPTARHVPSIGREPITAQNYSSRPYSRAHRGFPSVDSAQHRIDDDEVEQRVLAVMMSGQPDAHDSPSTLRNKKDTIIGLTDAYAGVDVDEQPRTDPPQRSSSRKHDAPPPMQPEVPPLPTPRNADSGTASNNGAVSSRVDSKPLRDLEALFERLPAAGLAPVREEDGSSASVMSRASVVSTYGQRYTRDEGAFSLQAPPTRNGSLAAPRTPAGHAPPKESYLDVSDTPRRAGFDNNGFESLDEMNARKHADPSYRSATLSMYDMY